MDSNLVPLAVGFLHCRIVGVLVRHEESSLDVTAVRIFAISVEDVLIKLNVIVVDGVIECDGDHLWDILGWKISGDQSAVLGTETVRQDTHCRIAGWSAVWIVVIIWTRQGELTGWGTLIQAARQLSLSARCTSGVSKRAEI
jgi:hypothetical protein